MDTRKRTEGRSRLKYFKLGQWNEGGQEEELWTSI